MFDYKKDFPILNQKIVYLDTAASAQKPLAVIDAMSDFIKHDYANIHRGIYDLSQRASDRYESARETVKKFINARNTDEVIFTHGGTESANLVAYSYGREFLREGDEVVITELEHHANIVPWQVLRKEKGIKLSVVPIDADGSIPIEKFKTAISDKTKIVSFAHVSNVLGTILPVKEITALAHAVGAVAVVDACQSVQHLPIDVQNTDADFLFFSGHKLYGPTGIGVLYVKRALLEKMPPYQTGGGMISSVSFDETLYAEAPLRFEAGTPPIIEAIGLQAAMNYVKNIGLDKIAAHEHSILKYADEKLSLIPGLKILSNAGKKSAIVSFVIENIHSHDAGTILNNYGVAVRAGHHCAQPLMDSLGVSSTVRASFGLYSAMEDVDALAAGIYEAKKIFGN
ncbi:MAG: SufS family cysteine desulfurase [Alphaproteobacteria bacterium]|nr:SufS family cysteine desulfurase [Alphaproteobacteria bacterium]MCL2505407.1 SufS family cysteine desulfurase [Alphaproteobacteria bacterium]